LTAVVAVEVEFHLFAGIGDDGRPLHTQTGPQGRAPIGGQTYGIDAMREAASFMHDVRDAAIAQGLPVDTLIAEAGASQFEVNLHHQADALCAADQAVMLERLLKGVAGQHGLRATFMAKPFADEPGNGMHVHVSLVDDAGNNVFDDGGDAGSEVLSHAIAGCLGSLPDCMLVFAPKRNSYRRFARDSHAPLAPCWGYDNRTVAVRVPAGPGGSRRIEHRLPGADASVYLVVASILAGIADGIDAGIAPPEPVAGDAYEQCPASLPLTWTDALAAFRASDFVARHFGATLRKVYAGVRQQEIEEFERFISPLEYHTYL